MIYIGLIGDHNPEVKAHQAIPKVLELAADQIGEKVSIQVASDTVIRKES
jgi:hypothetical protein